MAAVLFAALLFAFLAYGEELPAFGKFTCEGGYFTAQVPSAWTPSDRTPPYADMTKVFGKQFIGPAGPNGVDATIALHYYSGERHFTTPEAFIKARQGSFVREDYERAEETSTVLIAGRKAVEFHMRTFELIMLPMIVPAGNERPDDPHIIYERRPMPSKEVHLYEQYIVLPASKGFFVLHFRAEEDSAESLRPVFEKVTASFEPTGP